MEKCQKNKLIDAVFAGNINEIKNMLLTDIDVNSLDPDGRSVLFHAVIDRQHKIAELLLSNKADVNIKDFQQMSPLHFAAQNYDLEMCKILIEAGAVIDSR